MFLLLACTSTITVEGSTAAPDASSHGPQGGVEAVAGDGTDTPPDTLDADEAFPLDEEGCPAFYAQDHLPEIALDFEPDELAALEQDRRNYAQNLHPARFTYEGEQFEVMVRLRGNTFPAKYELSISFNEVDPDARFHGLRKVALDAATYETTMLRSRVAAWWLRKYGVPAYCANNAALTINGSYFGLYSNTEDVDHEFLERNFEDPSGTSYKDGATAKSNEENAVPEHIRAWATATDPDVLATYLDIDQVMRAWALEAALPNTDGFVYGLHNFYLYDDPERGFVYIPFDLDFSFDGSQHLDVQPYTVDPLTYQRVGNGPQFLVFRNDPEWRDRYVSEIAGVMEEMQAEELVERWTTWDAQIHDALEADPNRLYDMPTHNRHVEGTLLFIEQRVEFMNDWVARQ